MSKTTQRVDIYKCDKPGCPVKHYAERGPDGDKPDGLYGSVVRAFDGWVSSSLPWYACGEDHVGDAIAEVIRRDEENRDG